MPWQSLSQTLNSRPRILAGPILRKVTPTSVTVWVAMRVHATVALTVSHAEGVVATGTASTVALGTNLHIVAVTANTPPNEPLEEAFIYRYDMTFLLGPAQIINLAQASGNALLAYSPFTLPTFSLPPRDLNRLRLLQGSCRRPHAPGVDMLPYIDTLIASSAVDPFSRPHQLLLTGDQIYADDVAASMLLMLVDASTTLLGWSEILPIPSTVFGAEADSSEKLSPLMRGYLLFLNRFTSEDLENHLVSLGDYLCMYLFVWSDVLWPRSPVTLPSVDDIELSIRTKFLLLPLISKKFLPRPSRSSMQAHIDRLNAFRQTLPAVRRVLANVPSYMIFDDHEVTDDWNMTREFCENVYGSDLGLRLVQNALAAYSLCQHWGNAPEDFTDATPGRALLQFLDTPNLATKPADYSRDSASIRGLLGIHAAAALRNRAEHGLFHDANSLKFHFTVEGTGHQVIFTDTRTWRSYPNATHPLPKNTQTNQFKRQIIDVPETRDRLLLVVLSTNMPPVQPIRALASHDRLANLAKFHPDIYEAWELPSVFFDRMLTALASKLPESVGGQRTGAAIVLSGDVHHSFASRIIYRATHRFEDAQPQAAAAVIAQLVASPFKNQDDNTQGLHREGYFFCPIPLAGDLMIREVMTEGYVGFNASAGSTEAVGERLRAGLSGTPVIERIKPGTIDVTGGTLVMIRLFRAPDFRYRLDYLLPDTQLVQLPPAPITPQPPPTTPAERFEALEMRAAAMRRYDRYNLSNPPKVVGLNNFGEMRFIWGATNDRKVNHILHWWDPVGSTFKTTTYAVRLDVNSPTDPQFPDIRAVEP